MILIMAEIIKWFNESFSALFKNDEALISSKIKEETINHRLLYYLELFCPTKYKEYNFDMEYDKLIDDKKKIKVGKEGGKNIRPDIIIHKRNTFDNLFVFECKKSYLTKFDKKKLKCFKNSQYNYSMCLGVSYLPNKKYFLLYKNNNPIRIIKSDVNFEEIL